MVSTVPTESAKNEDSAAKTLRLPELLAPAGDWDCAKAAVENGADTIYFGLEKFNARMRAHNFTEADLPKLMEFLHRRGVKGYVTFNTLVFENELADAEKYLRAIISAGVDAAIVQDVGICRLIRKLSPDFPIHASTQMTVTSAGGVEFARELGCNLVVLARECSIKEIEKINAAQVSDSQSSTFNPQLPLEVFVHGALCVAYSGQCLTSESLGGRSANRGECAQACRMPYDLISDGKQVPLGDKRYLLSPQDLAGLEVLPDLICAGVASLKIEGRLKSPEYVASITKVYRNALDRIFNHQDKAQSKNEISGWASSCLGGSTSSRYELEMSFSRGLHTGWFDGIDNQKLVHARFGKKRGVFLGEVLRVQGEKVFLKLEAPLKLGDGVVFDAGRPDEKEEGGRIYGIQNFKGKIPNTEESVLEFGYGNIDFNRVHVGNKLWKTNDPELDKKLRQSFAGNAPKFQRPIEIEVHGVAGKPLTLIARDELGHVVQFDSVMPLAKAEKQPLTTERLREQLGRLGGTPFTLGELKSNLSGEVMLSVSELNRLRRDAANELEKLRAQPKRWQLNGHKGTEAQGFSSFDSSASLRLGGKTDSSELIVLVRSLPQLEAALKCGVQTVYCEFEDLKKYRDAVTIFHTAYGCSAGDAHGMTRPTIWVAPPRIFKTGEEWILKQVLSSNADGYLVRNYDHLKFFADCRKRGDYSLNIANRFAADYFKNKFGLESVTPSYDLNFLQLEALLQSAPPEWFEVTIHQHMPMFHMEHCVFCAFLSDGTDYTNCGRPCDTHVVKLRDRVGAEHALKADAGCRNTVFNSQTQTGAEYIAKMIELGVRNFRVEFLDETPETVERTIAKYRQLLRGEIDGTQLWRELKLMNQLGVTRGQIAKL
jgi:U32 family peptidase